MKTKLDRLTRQHIKAVEQQERAKLRAHCAKLATMLADVTGYLASVRTDRKCVDSFGEVMCAQTMEWAESAKEIAEKANALLEEHDVWPGFGQ